MWSHSTPAHEGTAVMLAMMGDPGSIPALMICLLCVEETTGMWKHQKRQTQHRLAPDTHDKGEKGEKRGVVQHLGVDQRWILGGVQCSSEELACGVPTLDAVQLVRQGCQVDHFDGEILEHQYLVCRAM